MRAYMCVITMGILTVRCMSVYCQSFGGLIHTQDKVTHQIKILFSMSFWPGTLVYILLEYFSEACVCSVCYIVIIK